MKQDTLWHNGAWHINDHTLFSVRDRLRYGDGVFDTMLVINSVPLFPARHFARLSRHATILDIPMPCEESAYQAILEELLSRNQAYEGHWAINTLLTRGVAERGLMPPGPEDTHPSLTILASPTAKPSDLPPLHAIIASTVRRNEGSPLSQIKSCNYADHILALSEAKRAGANEAILLNNQGAVTCASSGNIIALLNGQLYTPPLRDGVMDGTLRSELIACGLVQERALSEDDLTTADALYITNSIRGAAPLASLNGRALTPPDFLSHCEPHKKALAPLFRMMNTSPLSAHTHLTNAS